MTEEPQPASTVIARVLIAYAEQPGLTLDELKARVEGLVSLFTLLEESAVIRDRRIISLPRNAGEWGGDVTVTFNNGSYLLSGEGKEPITLSLPGPTAGTPT